MYLTKAFCNSGKSSPLGASRSGRYPAAANARTPPPRRAAGRHRYAPRSHRRPRRTRGCSRAAAATGCRPPAPGESCAAPAVQGGAHAGRSRPRRAPCRTRSLPPKERRGTPPPSTPTRPRPAIRPQTAGDATLETGRLRHLGATIEAHVFGFGAGSRKGVPSLPARSLSARFSSLRALPAGASG